VRDARFCASILHSMPQHIAVMLHIARLFLVGMQLAVGVSVFG
jgi:hypothetical protein